MPLPWRLSYHAAQSKTLTPEVRPLAAPSASPGPGGTSPLTAPPTHEHLAQIAAAKALGAKIRRAAMMATIDGWIIAIFAFFTLLGSIFSISGLMLGIGMCVVACWELRSAGQLTRLDPLAPRRLALNQLVLGGLLLMYGAFNLWRCLTHPQQFAQAGVSDPQLVKMLGPVDELVQTIYLAVYGTVMAVAIVGPGLTALYYASRKRYIERYLEQTPQWIIDLQRAGMSL